MVALFVLINRRDIMNLLLLGYLSFCVAINPAESSDWEEEFTREILDLYNCTRCDEVEQDTSCLCFEYTDKCIVCCSGVPCCSCADCGLCWQKGNHRELIIMTQIIISVLFVFGIIGLFVVYFKICYRTRQHTRRHRRCVVLHEERDLTTQCSIVEDLRDRPPSYNEVVRSAPPLYTSSYNRTSMQEAPPSYPGTPKPQEKTQDSNVLPSSPSVAQHM
ncbi:uncharacterized protein LOC105837164 isoform X2 [Monomorium pharaonis]|uniref:uncharacterized protein LOC105837164 isoform X2 n=1 Tax=Monomorium pharaonis TaxID=307658 RepID=UPI001746C7A6|nr:uncharacterized protein LOC105837164 isoform X2 [Monomorium pharaonis]